MRNWGYWEGFLSKKRKQLERDFFPGKLGAGFKLRVFLVSRGGGFLFCQPPRPGWSSRLRTWGKKIEKGQNDVVVFITERKLVEIFYRDSLCSPEVMPSRIPPT